MKIMVGFNVLSQDPPLVPETDEERRLEWADPMAAHRVDYDKIKTYVSGLLAKGHTLPDGENVEFINLEVKVS